MKKVALILVCIFTVGVLANAQNELNQNMAKDIDAKVEASITAINQAIQLSDSQKEEAEMIFTHTLNQIVGKRGEFESKEAFREFRLEKYKEAYKTLIPSLSKDQVKKLKALALDRGVKL